MLKRILILSYLFYFLGSHSLFADDFILRKKSLALRYELQKKRLEIWQKRKEKLIKEFNEKYSNDIHFGNNGEYGKKRFLKRRDEFYKSLDDEEREIRENLSNIKEEMRLLDRGKSKVSNKKNRKLDLLYQYLSLSKKYKRSAERYREFSNEFKALSKDINRSSDVEVTKLKKLKEKLKNERAKIEKYDIKLKRIINEYRRRYDYEIRDEKVAKFLYESLSGRR
jgi:hypothetical protein